MPKLSEYAMEELAEQAPKRALTAPKEASFQRLAKKIQSETGDGQELLTFAMDVWRDTSRNFKDRWDAFTWLSERGFGRSPQIVDIHMSTHTTVGVDLTKLSIEQIKQLEKLLSAAVAENQIVDIE
jgi:hypothetical protein